MNLCTNGPVAWNENIARRLSFERSVTSPQRHHPCSEPPVNTRALRSRRACAISALMRSLTEKALGSSNLLSSAFRRSSQGFKGLWRVGVRLGPRCEGMTRLPFLWVPEKSDSCGGFGAGAQGMARHPGRPGRGAEGHPNKQNRWLKGTSTSRWSMATVYPPPPLQTPGLARDGLPDGGGRRSPSDGLPGGGGGLQGYFKANYGTLH